MVSSFKSPLIAAFLLLKDLIHILIGKEAIHKGVQLLKENEVLLILGKGHEKYQEIDNKFIPFDDVQITKEIMELEN